MYSTKKKKKILTGRSMRKPFRGQFEGSCDALNFSHNLSQRRCRLISVIERQKSMHLCVTLLYMFTDIQLSCRTQ